ncbi:MAG: hypothetical protein IJ011_09155 [Clostridia bacterium]|nr:hypothetical protein [Clostridia bacterium]
MKKRILCMLLVLLFLLAALVGCKNEAPDTEDSGKATDVTDATETSTNTESTVNDGDTLPTVDYGGKEYRILSRTTTSYEFDPEKVSGDTLSNAIFTRNEQVRSRYNVTLAIDETPGGWGDMGDFSEKYLNTVQSGWSPYSLVSAHFSVQMTCVVNGYTYDLTDIEYLDMEKEWWSKQFYEDAQINGKFYIAVGDIAYTLYEYMQVVFFNETLANNYIKDSTGEPIDFYELVEEGEWTWENFKKYSLAIPHTTEDDYGVILQGHAARGFITSCEISLTEADTSGAFPIYSFPEVLPLRTTTFGDDFLDFVGNNAQVYFRKGGISEKDATDMFNKGSVLFYTQQLSEMVGIADGLQTGNSYGLLPLPMYDDSQLEYHTVMRDSVSGVTIPKNIKDSEFVGLITEALAMYSYQEVRPTYYDVVMDGRYMVNEQLSDMLDLLRRTIDVDFIMAYNSVLGKNPYSLLTNIYEYGNGANFTSNYEGQRGGYQSDLESLYKFFGVNVK